MNSSEALFEKAKRFIPGGVNSPVRAFQTVGMNPFLVERGAGSKIYDIDGQEYIDYVMSWGALILGHAHPEVLSTLEEVAARGTTFGMPTARETDLAQLICKAFPSIEKVRLVSSGTEAVMSAIRVARAFTGRKKIIKFDGCYHGHSDGLLIKTGSGGLTFGVADSAGVPEEYARLTHSFPYNDVDTFRRVMRKEGSQVACVIVEPVAANMGVIVPQSGFLETLREETEHEGAVLIFDEVISGFRIAWGGAQELFRVPADLTCLGKIVGGGLPLAAFGGKQEIMDQLAPDGPVYQAGTLSGNPLAVACGLRTLGLLKRENPYDQLAQKTEFLVEELIRVIRQHHLAIQVNHLGSLFTLFWGPPDIVDLTTALQCDRARYGQFFRAMLKEGIFLAPSQFEANFVSLAHSDRDLHGTIRAFSAVVGRLS